MNIVIYARYSSDKQTEQSIEGQLRVCHDFAERNGYTIINEYIDRAITGTSDKRPAFLQMIDDARKKEFQYILVYKLDRFSRNKYDSVVYKHKLAGCGVKVISATEAISDSPEGKLVEGLLEMMAEMYSQDLSQKVTRGMKESILKGKFIGGSPLYGYKVENSKLVIDEEKAPAIRYFFEQYAKGISKKEIIDELNKRGFRKKNGKLLDYRSFVDCASNKKYIGEFECFGIKVKDYCPAIVSEELFYKVQEQLKKHKHYSGSGKAKEEYILTGKIYCGYCGEPIVGVSGTGYGSKTHRYYVCSKRYSKHDCVKKYEKKELLENEIIEFTKQKILNSQLKFQIIDRVYEKLQNCSPKIKIDELNKQILKIDLEIEKCFDMYLNAKSEELKHKADNKANELGILKNDLKVEISKLQLLNKSMKTKQDIIDLFNLFVQKNETELEYRKRIVDCFIDVIYLYDDRIGIYYSLFDNERPTFLDFKRDIENLSDIGEVVYKNKLVRISNAVGHHTNLNQNG